MRALWVSIALLLVWPALADATVYWAATTGSNSATCSSIDSVGTADAPGTDPGAYGTIGRAAECATVAGDVVNVKAGTYTSSQHRIDTAFSGGTVTAVGLKAGTSESVRTYVQGDPSGARPVVQGFRFYCTFKGASRAYITIRHFELDEQNGGGTCSATIGVEGQNVTITDVEIRNSLDMNILIGTSCTSASCTHTEASGARVINNTLHHAGGDGTGYGVYTTQNNTIIERNDIYSFKGYAIHAYSDFGSVDGSTIQYNYVHAASRATLVTGFTSCSGIVVTGSSSIISRNIIDLSTCQADADASSAGVLVGFNSAGAASITHNLIYQSRGYGVRIGATPTGAQAIYNNIFFGNVGTTVSISPSFAGSVAYTHNACESTATCATANKTTISALTDIIVSTSNYTHAASSVGIDVGKDLGDPYTGSLPDLGPFEVLPAGTTTYYVDDTGHDIIGDGTGNNPWRNPQRCIGTVPTGGTCSVGDGIYTDTDGDGIVIWISSSTAAVSGTISQPITIRAANFHGAKLRVPAPSSGFTYGVRLSVPYHIIEGFEITDDGASTTQGAAASIQGISLGESGGAIGAIIRYNHIHDIARNICSNSTYGNAGIGGRPGSGAQVYNNSIHTIGRKLNGESGCATTMYANDHGVYVWDATNFTVRNNVLWDLGRGYAIHIYKPSQVSTNVNIYNNTISQPTLVAASKPEACMVLSYENATVNIQNNIFYNCPQGYAVDWFNAGVTTGILITHNLTDSADADLQNPSGKPSSGVVASANLVGSGSIGFTSIGSNDYTLTAASAAIGAGVDVGLPYNVAPTIGAWDPPRFSACQVPSGSASTIQVTFVNNVAPPMLPASGATTFTARKNTTSNPLSGSVARIGDNIQELPLTNTYLGGDTADISWAPGNLTDSSLIGGTLNQRYLTTLTNQSCTNNFGASYTLTQAAFELHGAYGPENNPIILPHGYLSTGGAENYASYPVYPGAKWRMRFALVCGGGSCPDGGYFLRSSANGGSYTVVGDNFGVDNIAFCGNLPGNPQNGIATTDQLTTGGTFREGGLVFTSNAIPIVTGLTSGDKTELEYCVKSDTDASGFLDFRVYAEDGSALTYAGGATPHIVIEPMAFGVSGQ